MVVPGCPRIIFILWSSEWDDFNVDDAELHVSVDSYLHLRSGIPFYWRITVVSLVASNPMPKLFTIYFCMCLLVCVSVYIVFIVYIFVCVCVCISFLGV